MPEDGVRNAEQEVVPEPGTDTPAEVSRPTKEDRDKARKNWEAHFWETRLPAMKVRAAKLLGELNGDFDRVRAILGLPEGEVEKWFLEDELFAHGASKSYDELHSPQAARVVLSVMDQSQRTTETMSVRLYTSPSFAIAKKAANRLPVTASPS